MFLQFNIYQAPDFFVTSPDEPWSAHAGWEKLPTI